MKNLKIYSLLTLLIGSMLLTGCLNILEEVTFKKDGSGMYSMMLDMGEMKSMMDMFKNMAPGADSSATVTGGEKDIKSEDVDQDAAAAAPA